MGKMLASQVFPETYSPHQPFEFFLSLTQEPSLNVFFQVLLCSRLSTRELLRSCLPQRLFLCGSYNIFLISWFGFSTYPIADELRRVAMIGFSSTVFIPASSSLRGSSSYPFPSSFSNACVDRSLGNSLKRMKKAGLGILLRKLLLK